MDKIETIIKELTPESTVLLNYVIGFFKGDATTGLKVAADYMKRCGHISDAIFWNNFQIFLEGGNFDYDILRKFSEKLEENGNDSDIAYQIVYAIDHMECEKKVRCLSHLTQALINEELTIEDYQKIVISLRQLTESQMIIIRDNLKKSTITTNLKEKEELTFLGMTRLVNGGYEFTERAYMLVKYGVNYGHSIEIPQEFEHTQIQYLEEY